MSRQVTHDGKGALLVRFTFDRGLVDRIKGLPNRRWIATDRVWSVPDTDVVLLVDALSGCNFRFDDATRQLYARMGGAEMLIGTAPSPAAVPGSESPRQGGLFDAPAPAISGTPGLVTGESDHEAPPRPSEFTVVQLNQSVQDALTSAFPDSLWVVGEISGFNKSKHRRIVGFQLVELDDDGRKQAEVAATLFDTERKLIERGLRRASNPFLLEDEVRVRLKVRVELYVPWGSYRVIVEDIDVKYTLGDAARRREEILRRLSEQGLVGVNSALPMSTLPLSVGLITSLGSDAYNDVMRTLQESGYAFRVAVHGARVQGRQTESSVLNALDWFRDRKDTFDVVMICRGGGSRTDLAWFDSEPLGRAVACFPVPVVIGIGHEQDHSVLDALARRAKTPTAAAGVIVDAVAQTELATEQLGRGIVSEATERIAKQQVDSVERGRRLVFATRSLLLREQDHLQGQRQRAVRASRGLVSAARQALSRAETAIPRAASLLLGRRAQDLGALLRSLVHSARRDLSAARLRVTRSGELLPPRVERLLERRTEQIGTREHRLGLVDPRRVLERGYSILRNADGGVVTAADQALAGTLLRAELRHGTLRLKSEGPAEDPNKD